MTRRQQIFVSCTDGHIALSGSVRTEEERRAAQKAVASIPGVTGVLNDIVTFPTSPSKFGGM